MALPNNDLNLNLSHMYKMHFMELYDAFHFKKQGAL